jgi:hypothetical protein
MKHILALALSLAFAATIGKAQNFSGTISYKMEVKNLPAGVPQAMIDQFVPSKMAVYVKGSQIATTTNAGPLQHIIMNSDTDTAYMIMNQSKTILSMTSAASDELKTKAAAEKPDIKKTNQTAMIAGYMSNMYEVTTTLGDQTLKQEVWVTNKLKTPKPKVQAQSYFFSDIQGVMTRMTTNVMGMTLNIEATDISTTPPDDSVFALPAGYTCKPFSQEAIMQSMGK